MHLKNTFILKTLCLSLSLYPLPLQAGTFTDLTTPVKPPLAFLTSAPMTRPLPPPHKCEPCHRPFKRLVAAMHHTKKDGSMTQGEFKKAFDALMNIPRDTFKDSKDMDQTAADTLYKSKVITEEQYQKICGFLKNSSTIKK